MTATPWPANLPSTWLAGLRYAPRDQVLRSPMDSGVGKTRRRTTLEIVDADVEVRFSGLDVQNFESWFRTTLSGGAARFSHKHALTGALAEYRFRARPEWRQEIPGTQLSSRWLASFALEILP